MGVKMTTGNEFWKGRKVFITGHTGFKGSWLSMILQHLGAELTGYALVPPTDPSLYELAGLDSFVRSHISDIRDLPALKAALVGSEAEIIFHMAAQALVLDSYKDPVDTYSTNVMGSMHLLQAVREAPAVRVVVMITTDKCYENREWIWGYRENDPLGGYDPYSSSKACVEILTASMRNSFFQPSAYEQHHVAVASARAGNVIGGGDWARDRLIPDIIRALLNNEKIIIRNPSAIRPWQHVLEPLAGYILLAEKLFREGPRFAEAWNFGPEDADTGRVEWIVKCICELWGHEPGYEVVANKQHHEAGYLRLDCSKAKHQLGWKPRWNLDIAIENIIGWTKVYRDKGDIREVCLKQIEGYFNG